MRDSLTETGEQDASKKSIAKLERKRLKELAEAKKKQLQDLHAKHNNEAAGSDVVRFLHLAPAVPRGRDTAPHCSA